MIFEKYVLLSNLVIKNRNQYTKNIIRCFTAKLHTKMALLKPKDTLVWSRIFICMTIYVILTWTVAAVYGALSVSSSHERQSGLTSLVTGHCLVGQAPLLGGRQGNNPQTRAKHGWWI